MIQFVSNRKKNEKEIYDIALVPCLWQAAHLPRPGYGIQETTKSGWEIK